MIGAGLDRLLLGGIDNRGVVIDLAALTFAFGGATSITGIERIFGTQQADAITGDGGDNLLGGAGGNDTLLGSGGRDSLNGGSGGDTMLGGADDDLLLGGVGGDRIDGGDGYDTASYRQAAAAVTVDLAAPANSAGEAGGDSFADIERYWLSANDDSFTGDGNGNAVLGYIGNDTLNGGGGNDRLYGGLGDDVFVVTDGWGRDRIVDFTDGDDLLDFSGVTGANSFADLDVRQVGANTIVSFGADSIVLLNFTAANLTAADFLPF